MKSAIMAPEGMAQQVPILVWLPILVWAPEGLRGLGGELELESEPGPQPTVAATSTVLWLPSVVLAWMVACGEMWVWEPMIVLFPLPSSHSLAVSPTLSLYTSPTAPFPDSVDGAAPIKHFSQMTAPSPTSIGPQEESKRAKGWMMQPGPSVMGWEPDMRDLSWMRAVGWTVRDGFVGMVVVVVDVDAVVVAVGSGFVGDRVED